MERNISSNCVSHGSLERTKISNILIKKPNMCTAQNKNSTTNKNLFSIIEKYSCKLCDETFLHDEYLKLHSRNVHNLTINKIKIKCEFCGKVFFNGTHFKEHSFLHRDEEMLCSTNDVELSSKIDPTLEDISANSEDDFYCENVAEISATVSPKQGNASSKHEEIGIDPIVEDNNGTSDDETYYENDADISTTDNCNQVNSNISAFQREGTFNPTIPHTGDIFCQCSDCTKDFMLNTTPDTTLRTEQCETNTKPRTTCEMCKRSFKASRSLTKHMKNVHGGKKDSCKICYKVFNASYLQTHMKNQHSCVKKRADCLKCGKTFSNKSSLTMHERFAHNNTAKFIKSLTPCEVCGKEFANERSLYRHRQRMHTAEDKLTCAHCNLKFKDRYSIVMHMKVMHLPPTVKCHMCDILLPTNLYLKKHLLVQHSIGKVQSFICETCGRVFKNKLGLDLHLRTSHSTSDKMFKCNYCEKSFNLNSHLKQHSLVHSDSRKFNCGLCGKSFKFKHHLKQHMAVHGLESTPDYTKRQTNREIGLVESYS